MSADLTFRLGLDPAAISLLERILDHHDRSRLTRRQSGAVRPVKDAVRRLRDDLNLVMRSDPVLETGRAIALPHPDRRETGALMVYDKRAERLLADTPFTAIPDPEALDAWIEAQGSN